MSASVRGAFAGLVLSAGLLGWGPAVALGVSPTLIELPAADPAQIDIRIQGSETARLAVELSVLERVVASDDTAITRGLKEDELRLVPPQLLMDPGGSQQVTMTWAGDRATDGSRSFFLVIETLPVELDAISHHDDMDNDVKLLTRFHLPVHVYGSSGSSEVAAYLTEKGDMQVVRIENSGDQYALMKHLDFLFELNGEKQVTIPGSDMARVLKKDAILPGESINLKKDKLFVSEDIVQVDVAQRNVRPSADRGH
ncbi:P pilus assembly protein, chaperone PapD [Modicisalibacter ilicicola DSM 19980]|uniref:P pilus assembly protein, chaperone PapD n=1 Tax=Modicisalibacter ilicicola DSM 19980 TaxID=1121942 RepID=A0A1M4ZBG8_9GAMM|nr:molecular chaperone [Halomonas ilicicola]SHF15364.1 P pilus assembly protein, chaperone PapD [Halomonas ilicicola DSM 19980]